MTTKQDTTRQDKKQTNKQDQKKRLDKTTRHLGGTFCHNHYISQHKTNDKFAGRKPQKRVDLLGGNGHFQPIRMVRINKNGSIEADSNLNTHLNPNPETNPNPNPSPKSKPKTQTKTQNPNPKPQTSNPKPQTQTT
jgi:hypothetical protein